MTDDTSEPNLVTLQRQKVTKEAGEPARAWAWYPRLAARGQIVTSAQSLTFEGSHIEPLSLFLLFFLF